MRKIITTVLIVSALNVNAHWKYVPEEAKLPVHPRILLLKGEEQALKEAITSNAVMSKIHSVIIEECGKIMQKPELERRMTGKRLLSVSGEALKRIFYLSYAYRMTGEMSYKAKAEKEMVTIAGFRDWNPSHFLDVGEMTMALAIGYDWLYDALSGDARRVIADAILQKGLDASFTKWAWYKAATHNWNQVCNAGITYGALSVHEVMPELSNYIIDNAIESIKLPMADYAPDGGYPEGYGYWGYGTTFNVLFISAIEKVFGTDYGLSEASSFLKTAYFQQNMTGVSHQCFNFCDCGLGGSLSPAMFWFASKLNDPSLLWNEKYYLENKPVPLDRILPALLLWGSKVNINDIRPPKELLWSCHGITPVALMRTSWTDPKAIFVGFKGGIGSSNHAHLDAGSFVMEANGVRWVSDFGAQDYNSLETKGVDLWNRSQNSQRWDVFRYNNLVHSTLTVDGQLHRVDGHADIIATSSNPDYISAIVQLQDVYKGQLASCQREIAIVKSKEVVVKDAFKTLDKETVVRWTLLTGAKVKLRGDKGIELTQDGKKLSIEIASPIKITLKTWSTTPPHDYDAPNPGTTLTGFEATVPAGTTVEWTVKLIPK